MEKCGELEGFRYQPGGRARGSFCTSAHGAWARLAAGVAAKDLEGHLERLVHDLPAQRRKLDRHYMYWHGHLGVASAVTLAARTEGQAHHAKAWRSHIRKELLALQEEDGSWSNPVGPGAVYATAIACLLLGY